MNIADLRQNYTRAGLIEADAALDPFQQFHTWFQVALSAQILEPNAMTLATTTADGKPSARILLLKDFDARGFVFYTNYESLKAQQLSENPHAAIVFWWGELERQIRIEGKVEKVNPEESDRYFHSRPISSQIGAWASNQSRVVPSRDVLENKQLQLEKEYQNKEIPRPPHWGGFRVVPSVIEFWQGRPSRLHDRLRYSLQDDVSWLRERLAP
jgi:pyridoxamine 5'-phosphate oxidase